MCNCLVEGGVSPVRIDRFKGKLTYTEYQNDEEKGTGIVAGNSSRLKNTIAESLPRICPMKG
jgi:hypothetical protein